MPTPYRNVKERNGTCMYVCVQCTRRRRASGRGREVCASQRRPQAQWLIRLIRVSVVFRNTVSRSNNYDTGSIRTLFHTATLFSSSILREIKTGHHELFPRHGMGTRSKRESRPRHTAHRNVSDGAESALSHSICRNSRRKSAAITSLGSTSLFGC